MITWAKSKSDGSLSLAHMLMVAIMDYQQTFGREPRMIQIPWWRGHEMPKACINHDYSWKTTFRGVPFRFTDSDYIELSA